MAAKPTKLVLWTGPKHSGKTTAADELARRARAEGFAVTGLLAPAVRRGGKLIGFDALDLRSESRVLLARRTVDGESPGPFAFSTAGLEFGRKALRRAGKESAELVIVDEFGPVELGGGGWRTEVDRLLASAGTVVLLVVRREIADRVAKLYGRLTSRQLPATGPESIAKVITILSGKGNGMEKQQLHEEVLKRVRDGKIACRQCFEVAQECGVPLKDVGEVCNEEGIRIRSCQLGLFE